MLPNTTHPLNPSRDSRECSHLTLLHCGLLVTTLKLMLMMLPSQLMRSSSRTSTLFTLQLLPRPPILLPSMLIKPLSSLPSSQCRPLMLPQLNQPERPSQRCHTCKSRDQPPSVDQSCPLPLKQMILPPVTTYSQWELVNPSPVG